MAQPKPGTPEYHAWRQSLSEAEQERPPSSPPEPGSPEYHAWRISLPEAEQERPPPGAVETTKFVRTQTPTFEDTTPPDEPEPMPPPSEPSGRVDPFAALFPSKPPPEPTGDISKQEMLDFTKRQEWFQRGQVGRQKWELRSLKDTGMYTYTRDGTVTTLPGWLLKERYLEPAVGEQETSLFDITQQREQIRTYPKGTTFIRTDTGYDVTFPDTRLDWSKARLSEIEKMPSPFKEMGQFFFMAGTGLTSIAAPSTRYMETLGPRYYGFTYNVPLYPKGIGEATYQRLSKIHFPAFSDIVYEPLGLAPKGSTEVIKSSGPFGIAGSIGMEALQFYSFSKFATPVVKYAGKTLSPFVTKIKYTIKPSSEFALKGATVKVGYQLGKPSIIARGAIRLRGVVGRMGITRAMHISSETAYRSPLLGLPKVTESGKIIYGTAKIWMHAEGPTYRKLLEGFTTGGSRLVYDPFRKMTYLVGKQTISKPYGFLGRDVKVTQAFKGLQTFYLDIPTTDFVTRTAVWKIPKGLNFFGDTVATQQILAPQLFKAPAQLGVQTLLIPTRTFATPVSSLLSGLIYGAGMPFVKGEPEIKYGAILSQLKMPGVTLIQERIPKHKQKQRFDPLTSFETDTASISVLGVAQARKSAKATKYDILSFQTTIGRSVFAPKPTIPKIPFWLPDKSLLGRGKRYDDWELFGKKYKFRAIQIKSPFGGKI